MESNSLSQILELRANNTQSLTFSQLGARDGLHFLGSIRGVLPIGPNGVPALNTLKPSPLPNTTETKGGIISYNYTLGHQGLAVNVSCSYAPTCIVEVGRLDPNSPAALAYNASCASLGGIEVSQGVFSFRSSNGSSTLVYWPCQSVSNEIEVPSYSIYMCGRQNYDTPIGNMTCTVSSQSAIFPVTYKSTSGIFSTGEPGALSPIVVSTIINDSLVALGGVISEGQNSQANLVAESVITFAVKSFEQEPDQPSPKYLQLFERMIQGILEYEVCPVDNFHFIYLLIVVPQATYVRLIYSTNITDVPSSCTRAVTGSLSYEVLGWFMRGANIGLLIPITMINLAAFVVLVAAIVIAKRGGYQHHPYHPRPISHHDDRDQDESVPDEWMHKIMPRPTTVWSFFSLIFYVLFHCSDCLTGGSRFYITSRRTRCKFLQMVPRKWISSN